MLPAKSDFGAFVPGAHHIELASGRFLDLADPRAVDITIGDIAHGLANTCRFAGQSVRFYSVAEHAVLVSTRLRATGHDPETQLAGLHHDDSEAFLGDVTRPLKALLPGYADIEMRVTHALALVVRLPAIPNSMWHAAVKIADDWALACEAHHLMPSKGSTWFCADLYEPNEDNPVRCLPPEHARDEWLAWDRQLRREAGH